MANFKKGKEMRYAIIIHDGKRIGRIEKVFFPDVKSNVREVQIHGTVTILEDD